VGKHRNIANRGKVTLCDTTRINHRAALFDADGYITTLRRPTIKRWAVGLYNANAATLGPKRNEFVTTLGYNRMVADRIGRNTVASRSERYGARAFSQSTVNRKLRVLAPIQKWRFDDA